MLAKNKELEIKLQEIILQEQEEESERDYVWIEKLEYINFWDFLSVNYLDLDRFFTLLDIEDGPKCGWEKFVEILGLKLWEDRKWCMQYHGGAGPTRAALSKLLERNDCDRDISLSRVLELIKEMERFDILLQIDWQNLIVKFNCSSKNKSSIAENEDFKAPLILQLNCNIEPCEHLVKAENCCSEELNSTNKNALHIQINNKNDKVKKRKYPATPCILMTYAKDAEIDAIKVANQLRDENRKKVKVIMLGDPKVKRALVNDPGSTLHKWFNQVRYIVPVISPEYLKQVQNLTSFSNDRDETLYNRLIYKMAFDQYVSFGSRNLRCRPVCPERFYQDVQHHSVVQGNGLFSVIWTSKPDKVEELRLVLMDKPPLRIE